MKRERRIVGNIKIIVNGGKKKIEENDRKFTKVLM
ncbi:hypothetical protein EUBDOL_01994 [Amedibacillus dolichus DSM 3991]|uniref:Uncharacterized protein n=1 Tax=Amedibacillus dolichus DSM 3991 TaxID=428127 RepID=A8RDM7_9FIRM|nr:hypothetical protein EUBDOL_01994 [Amedibacillus dolichus DSM 3991]